MSSCKDNHQKINSELMEFNEKYIPNHSIILNTSPPRVGKTINTILYHLENKIPAIVFIDNNQQAKDIQKDIIKINKKYQYSLYYWQKKEKLCYILSNKDDIIKNEGQKFFETLLFKNNKGIASCKDCKYRQDCDWITQKQTIMEHDIVLMNKMNIGTHLVNSPPYYNYSKVLFYKYNFDDSVDPRTIIYDEKLEELHKDEFEKLNYNELRLFNKIIKLTDPSLNTKIQNNNDFIRKIKTIRKIFNDKPSKRDILKYIGFNFKLFGEFKETNYLEILFNKISNNIMILNYLEGKNLQLPKTNDGNYDFEYITHEKLYIDILFEKIVDHKIILLDATPLNVIVDRIKLLGNFKEITIELDIFDKKSSLIRIAREKRHVKTSRHTLASRNEGKKIESILEDKSYIPLLETNAFIKESKNSENINFGVVSYNSIKIKSDKNESIEFEPLDELKKVIGSDSFHTLYFGNSRGRSELNECDVLYIVGTHRHPPFSRYNLYRYLGGSKTPTELKTEEGHVDKLSYNDELFNEIINHQIDSEMEQVILRNMPHMKKD